MKKLDTYEVMYILNNNFFMDIDEYYTDIEDFLDDCDEGVDFDFEKYVEPELGKIIYKNRTFYTL